MTLNTITSELIREIKAYGYVIIPGANPDFKKNLTLINQINKELNDKSNKSLHSDRALDS